MTKLIRHGLWLAIGPGFSAPIFEARAAESTTNQPLLTIDRIFDSDEFSGETFGSLVWARSGQGYYKLHKAEPPRKGSDLVYFDCATTNQEVILPAHAFTKPGGWSVLPIESFQLSEDESRLLIFSNSERVWRQNTRGDYWVMDVTSRELRKLGGDAPPASLMFARFSPDGTKVAYVRGNNLYVESVLDGAIVPLTRDGSATLINGTTDWVYEEELGLREAYRWSPDSQSIAYWQIDSSGVREFSLVNYTEGMYPRQIPIPYPKTGQRNPSARVGVIPANGGKTRWLSIPGDPREHYLAQMFWASNGVDLAVQQLNRRQNTNLVFLANHQTGEARPWFAERDEAWVEHENEAQWIDQGRSLLWLSERNGWRHLYKIHRENGAATQLTRGNFDVTGVISVDAASRVIYFEASPTNAAQRYLFRVDFDGSGMEQVTPSGQPGTHSYRISPNGKFAIHTYSSAARPPMTELIELPGHTTVRKLEENKKLIEKLDTLKRPSTEFLKIAVAPDLELDAWAIKPPDFDPGKKYPLLVFVYGEPHGQTVRDSWGGKRQLWHWLLAQRGCVVVSIDNRGTYAPRGRDFRKIVYRQVGLLASSDQAEAVRGLLEQWKFLDAKRVGVWGWSGGGSMTLNAMFRFPDLYTTGIAVASVPNQRLYDTIYQERYMGLPSENAEGYRQGSPLNYAGQLQGNLLLIHGTGDDNVHYQGMEALINELVAHNKQFSMMSYPNRTHGIGEGANTTRHLYGLMTAYLETHLLKPCENPAREDADAVQ